ncbi:anaerobic ribonucleoside-triphosphate reductase activating protein [archaeon]|nr:anaerobic ribonucleoside-triphosphate reductase activating protein [archaeon]
MKVQTGGITELSTVDYPGHVASVLYLCGCPFRCPWCQNFTILDKKNCQEVESDKIVEKILENQPLVNGVCITGGEPLQQLEGTIEICRALKDADMDVKLDTNGFYPEHVKRILEFVDFIAMDIKAPLEGEKYAKATGRKDGKEQVEKLKQTLEIITKSDVEFEPRTTLVPTLIDSKEDILKIADSLKSYGINRYVLQQFRPEGGCLEAEYENYASLPRDYIMDLAREAKKILPEILIRTKESGEEKV